MKRKLIYLPSSHSEDIVKRINEYFDSGYEIDDILNADFGYYLILVRKVNEKYKYDMKLRPSDDKCTLIEEDNANGQRWVRTITGEGVIN